MMSTNNGAMLQCHAINSNNAVPPPPPVTASTRASSRKNRVYVLRQFLLKTYPNLLSNNTNTTTTILDVAGGKGDLSWLLCNVGGVGVKTHQSVVVDPRASTNHDHLIKSIQYLQDHPEEARERAIPHRPTHQPLAGLLLDKRLNNSNSNNDHHQYRSPLHLRMLVNDDLVVAVRNYLRTKDMMAWRAFWDTTLECARNALDHLKAAERHHDESSTMSFVLEPDRALTTILDAKLVVGFHPDQATEACIDLALLLEIPYCIIPCCVFPSEFPHRLTPEGTRVRCYDELLVYLQAKDEDAMKRDTLAFHETKTARNVVLYREEDSYTIDDR